MQRQKIILQLLPELNTGGTEQSAVDLAIFLKKMKKPSFLPFIASNDGEKEQVLAKNKITHFALPLQRKAPWAIWQNSRQIIKIIDECGVDVLHARSRAPAWAAWLAHKARPNTCFITTFHGTYGAQNALKRAYNRVMLKGPYTIANSLFIKQHIIETYGYPASRIVVAQRGANPAVFNPARYSAKTRENLRKKLGIPAASGPLLTLVGRLTRWKGQHIFIEALHELKHQKWHALIVGGPTTGNPYYAELQRLSQKYGLSKRITFTGNQVDVAQLYDLSDIVLSCSTSPEAFGRVAVEAQMMKKPVICTNLGGSRETVKNNQTGWLVAPNSPHALAQIISKALNHKGLLNVMGERARAWVRARFTTDRCCQNEVTAYKKLLKNK